MRSFRSVSPLAVVALAALSHGQIKATQIASGLTQPVGVYADPSVAGRSYVTQKGGQVVALQNGSSSVVADVSGLIDTNGERGLLGMAFDPNYATNNRVYLSYVDNTSKALRVVRTNGFDLSTSQTVIDVPHPTDAANHYGGTIRFGGDGMLYVGMGDGGGGNDPEGDAQNKDNLLGKILRLDVSGNGAGVGPSDNPFVNADGDDRIWAYGLRNPFKFSFDINGDLYIGDVGQDTREEIDRIGGNQGGANFGWRAREGFVQNPLYPGETVVGAVDPIFDYAHNGGGRSVTGGVVYRGSALGSSYVGRYFFGDYITRQVWSIDPNASDVAGSLIDHTAALGINPRVVSFDLDANGEIVLTDIASGQLYRIDAVPEPASMVALGLGALALIRRKGKR